MNTKTTSPVFASIDTESLDALYAWTWEHASEFDVCGLPLQVDDMTGSLYIATDHAIAYVSPYAAQYFGGEFGKINTAGGVTIVDDGGETISFPVAFDGLGITFRAFILAWLSACEYEISQRGLIIGREVA